MLNTICNGTVTLIVSPLIAAAFNSAATCLNEALTICPVGNVKNTGPHLAMPV